MWVGQNVKLELRMVQWLKLELKLYQADATNVECKAGAGGLSVCRSNIQVGGMSDTVQHDTLLGHM